MARLRRDQIMIAKEMVAREVSVRQVARQLGVVESSLRYRLGHAAGCARWPAGAPVGARRLGRAC